jgi:hypothetical protein
VGKPRERYRRKTGPRGGYIKDADWNAWGEQTGSTVTVIVDLGHVIQVWSEEPSHGWANPSLVGHNEVISVEWLDALGSSGEHQRSGRSVAAGHPPGGLPDQAVSRITLAGSLSRRRPWKRGCRSCPALVHSLNATWPTVPTNATTSPSTMKSAQSCACSAAASSG